MSPDPYCLNYSSAGYCLNCLENYTLNDKGICVSSDQLFYGCATRAYPCPKCAQGYFLNNSLCYARRCISYKPNRDCQACINYYNFDPTLRFCILYTCANPSCYESDDPPAGFYVDSSWKGGLNANGWLKISNCVIYNGANCGQCDGYRYPNPAILYNLCYPYNCQVPTLINCSNNCLNNFAPIANQTPSCLALNCLNWDSTGRCLQCSQGYQLNGGICVLVVIPFCQTINYTSLLCNTCISGFDLFNGTCRSSNCTSYSPTNSSLCILCNNGYLYDQNAFTCQLAKCSLLSTTTP